jgi:hypothetical protein
MDPPFLYHSSGDGVTGMRVQPSLSVPASRLLPSLSLAALLT